MANERNQTLLLALDVLFIGAILAVDVLLLPDVALPTIIYALPIGVAFFYLSPLPTVQVTVLAALASFGEGRLEGRSILSMATAVLTLLIVGAVALMLKWLWRSRAAR